MIFIDDTAYKEFKVLLDKAHVEQYKIRIALDRIGCRGPIFRLYADDASKDDIVELVNEITFISERSLIEEYGGFIIVSSQENRGKGVGIKPVVTRVFGCGEYN